MAKYWLHRVTGGDNALAFARPLLNADYISIGWSDFSEDVFVRDVKREGMTALERYMDKCDYGRPRNRWNLHRFICEMKAGDIVLVPLPNRFSVYEIVDDEVLTNESFHLSEYRGWDDHTAVLHNDGYFYNEQGQCIDLGFYRRVKKVCTQIPRDEYADQALHSRMKLRQTNADITDIRSSVDEAVSNFRQQRPINLRAQIIESASPTIKELIDRLVDDAKFEQLVEWYLRRIGANHVETPSRSESPTEAGDADKVAYFEALRIVIMVQVKKHVGTTDDWAVEQIRAYRSNHDFDAAYNTLMWVVSAADDFSEQARQQAEEAGVRLINGHELVRMLIEVGVQDLCI